MKVNGKPDRFFVLEGEQHFGGRFFPEENIDKLFLGGGDFVGRAFVGGQVPNQIQDRADVGQGRAADRESRQV